MLDACDVWLVFNLERFFLAFFFFVNCGQVSQLKSVCYERSYYSEHNVIIDNVPLFCVRLGSYIISCSPFVSTKNMSTRQMFWREIVSKKSSKRTRWKRCLKSVCLRLVCSRLPFDSDLRAYGNLKLALSFLEQYLFSVLRLKRLRSVTFKCTRFFSCVFFL